MPDRKEVYEVIVDLNRRRNELLEQRRAAEPESDEEAILDGHMRGLREALDALSELDDWDLPEWAVGVENVNTDEWEWYYPRAVKREDAIKNATEEAREDLDGKRSELNVYEVNGPMAVRPDGGTVQDEPEEPLPGLPRERSVPPRGDVPSTGFITPHQRNRFETIKNLTDEHTAVRLYGLVMGGEYAHFEKAQKAAIGRLHKRKQSSKSGVRWRYYCPDCEFIGAASPTYWNAEWGSSRHDSAVDGCDSTVFAYQTDEWDPDDVEALVERYYSEINARENGGDETDE